ncbi:MAG: 2-oxo-4-hydroxy-4-carboxy-5-ureidoimidazoline decarboxylase [Uliginosibacterium sp.]|nr:2-oxo-4-hydroxy-4-carboxy-5-ureidoimidazoline decarboxylase [Uliginosibacterium sp.]
MDMAAPPVLGALSTLAQREFVAALAGIFEHSPWVAERAWHSRPFATLDALHGALCEAMCSASPAEQHALICAPRTCRQGRDPGRNGGGFGSRASRRGADACSQEEFARLQALNAAYRAKFGFPFILAVRGLDREAIIARFAARLGNSVADEFAEALDQIARIAALRLAERFSTAPD